MRDAFEIGNRSIESAAISQAALHVGPAADGRNREIPLLVCHGATEGPILWINGATHGDEPEGAFSRHWPTPRGDFLSWSGATTACRAGGGQTGSFWPLLTLATPRRP